MHVIKRLCDLVRSTCSFSTKNFKWELSAVCIFQNEDRFLREWIEFHLLVGIQHFYMYNNFSSDNYKQTLKPYVEAGIVELIDWNYQLKGKSGWNKIQCNAYMDAIHKSKKKTRWLAILDTDEFLFPVVDNNLQVFLKDYRSYAGIGVNWQVFGTSQVSQIPSDSLMIELLTYQSLVDFDHNVHVKSIVQPQKVLYCNNPHFVKYKHGNIQVNADKVAFKGPFSPCVNVDKIRINHYWLRDEDFLQKVKIPRVKNWEIHFDLIELNKKKLSVLKNDAILKYVDALKKRMFIENRS